MKVIISPLPKAKRYELRSPIAFHILDRLYTVPIGFQTDGASIPRFAWMTTGTPYAPEHIRAAIVHDYLYQRGKTTRLVSDAIFRALLLQDGCGRYQAGKMYWALRIGGWIAWRRYREREG